MWQHTPRTLLTVLLHILMYKSLLYVFAVFFLHDRREKNQCSLGNSVEILKIHWCG